MFRFCSILIVLQILTLNSFGQIRYKGNVSDSASKKTLTLVSIENLDVHQGVFTDSKGNFTLEGKAGDHLLLTCVGYKNQVIVLKESMHDIPQQIYMALKPVQLTPVYIKKGPTEYQKDSARRADIYKDAFEYERQKSVMTPVTSIYQKFSKKHRNMAKFQDQIQDMEKQKFIDTRYTPELVQSLTKLESDSLVNFMNAYPMELDYARAASDLEIKMWIKYNFQDYIKKSGTKIK